LKLLTYLWKYIREWKLKLFTALLCLTFVTLSNLLYPWLLKLLVDRFSGGTLYSFNAGMFSLILITVFLLSAILGYYNYVLMQQLGLLLRNRLRSEFYSSLLYREISFYKDHRIGELSSRATEDISKLQPLFLNLVAPVYQNVLFITGCLIVMFLINWIATLIVLGLIVLIVPLIFLFSKKIKIHSAASQQKHSGANAFMEETLIGIREIKSFVLEKIKLGKYTERVTDASTNELEASKLHSRISQSIGLVLSILIVGVFYAGTSGTFSTGWSMGSIVAFYFYAFSVTMAFVAAGRVYLNYQVMRGATHRIIELLDVRPAETTQQPPSDQRSSSPFGKEDLPVKGKIEFKNVTFGYNTDVDVLKDLSFTAESGSWMLITGPSGCGKSTIANILLGFYECKRGNLLIDDKPFSDYNIYSLRRNIGFAAQEPVLFHGSVKENILFSENKISPERLDKVLKISCLDKFISELPEGIDTIIGERGITLSGGQRARIAIARAIVFEPAVLILDEANSMLEKELELELWNNLAEDRMNKTTIILSHHTENIPEVYKQLKLI
jgi:ABC-type multidrug transport system fused ATPase/permease subunit